MPKSAAQHLRTAPSVLLAEALARLEEDGGPVLIEGPDGREVAALISIEHAKLLEEFEDRRDVELATQVLKGAGPRKKWDDLKAELGL
jgi:hypothetical protein